MKEEACWYVALEKERGHSHISSDIAWTNAVNLNVVLAPLIAQGFCKLTKGALGSGVGGNGDATLEGEEGAKVDNLSSPPWNHVAAGGLRKEPDGFQIDVQNLESKVSTGVDKGKRR